MYMDALTESVKQQPIAVVTPGSYGLVDVDFLRNTVLEALFDPYDNVSGFVPLGKSLAALAKGDATFIYNQSAVPTFECSASNSTTLHENNLEAYMTIGCGDAVQINDTLAELQDYWVGGLKVSSYSDLLSSTRVFCARVFPGYKTHRPGRFQGPVGAKNVSFPLLLVGNRLDAGTAHAGAVQTAEAFPGSVVLTQDSLGHTSLVAPSQCLWGYFREYFVNGTLPAVGTSCPIDIELFPSANATAKRTILSAEEKRSMDAGWEISKAARKIIPRRVL
ncbi:TAP-like protein-domain-containing protein [Mycena olivaceomarginata]|nr:TAP-like protein-domain-containing protein [Mycena olivaceomarginata]